MSILLAELFAQTDRLRIVATLTGSGCLNFSATIFLLESGEKGFVGARDMSKSAAAFLGMSVLGRS